MAEKRSFNNPGSSLRTLIESAIRTDQREQAKQCTMQLDSLAAMLAEHRGEWHRKMGDNLPRFQLLDVPRELFVLVLRAAVRQGHKPCARIILEEELATPEEAKMQLGGTPILHTACARAHGPLAEWLVSSGTCGVNRLDAEGTPAIVWAATLICVVATDLLTGVLVGIGLSMLELIPHLSRLRLKMQD